MVIPDSHVTIHMAANLDGFIARKDGRADWLETSDEFIGGDTMDPSGRHVDSPLKLPTAMAAGLTGCGYDIDNSHARETISA